MRQLWTVLLLVAPWLAVVAFIAVRKGAKWWREIREAGPLPRIRIREILFLLIALVPGVWLTAYVAPREPELVPLTIAATLTLAASAILGWLYVHAKSDRIAVNECCAIAALVAYAAAQAEFRKIDRYGKGVQVYANPVDGAGFSDLYEMGGAGSGGKRLDLIGRKFAEATCAERAHRGYWFADITADASGPYDYAKQFGLCAVPVRYNRSGRNVFIVNHEGRVYQKDLASIPGRQISTGDAGEPATTWPDVEKEGWIPVGEWCARDGRGIVPQ